FLYNNYHPSNTMNPKLYYEQVMQEKTAVLVEAAKLLGILVVNERGYFQLVPNPPKISDEDENKVREILTNMTQSKRIILPVKKMYFPEQELYRIKKLIEQLSANLLTFSQRELQYCLLNNPALSSYIFW